jgi:DNA repair exonuclease SbcCD ATPase subunit
MSRSAAFDDDALINFDHDDSPPPRIEDPETEYRRTQAELDKLRARQEEIERKQREMEVLEAKRKRVSQGRRELSERLTRCAEGTERQLDHAQSVIKELNQAAAAFGSAIDQLEGLPTDITRCRSEELDSAIVLIEEAEAVFSKTQRRLANVGALTSDEADGDTEGSAFLGDDSAKAWFIRGLAFTAPVIAGLCGLLFVAKWLFA